jgi:hypothetical protein
MDIFTISVKDSYVERVSQLHEQNGVYYTFEYNKIKKKFMQIGVLSASATHVYVKQENQLIVELTKSYNGIWYHASSDWDEAGYPKQTDGIFGLNVGGLFVVECWHNDKLIEQEKVAVIPGSMSLEEYIQMQNEVVTMFEAFSLNISSSSENSIFKRIQRQLYPIEQLVNIIDQFTLVLEEIIASPSFELHSRQAKMHIQNIKKWTPKLLIEHITTGKEYLNTSMPVHSYNISEHQMIRQMIDEFLERISKEKQLDEKDGDALIQELQKINASNIGHDDQVSVLFPKLIDQIKREYAELRKRVVIFNNLHGKLSTYRDIHIFEVEPLEIEETHLFKMDVKYNEAISLYHRFIQIRKPLQSTMQQFVQSLLGSPTLYEVWILLKMIQQFTEWGMDGRLFLEEIKERHIPVQSLEGLDITFELPTMPFQLRILYNVHLPLINLKPDYIIGIQNKQTKEWNWHTLDAKYKPYSTKSEKYLRNDLSRSVKRYKEQIQLQDIHKIKTSALVHPDAKAMYWNIKDKSLNPNDELHSISHFYVIPSDTSALNVYFKRLIHEVNEFATLCPTCGHQNIGKKSTPIIIGNKKKYKTTYVCQNCEDVWVANYCGCCVDKGIDMHMDTSNYLLPKPLFKYPANNYNTQVRNLWDVHCPRCLAISDKTEFKQDESLIKEVLKEKVKDINVFELFKQQKNISTHRELSVCSKCSGSGYISVYRHIEAGVCFNCNGTGRR